MIEDGRHDQEDNADQGKEDSLNLDSTDRRNIDNKSSDIVGTQCDQVVDQKVAILY